MGACFRDHPGAFTARESRLGGHHRDAGDNLQTSWAAKRQRLSQPEREQWLEEALTYMHTRPPWRMKSTGRATQGPTDRWLLMARQWKPGEVVVGKEDVGASARKRVPRHKLSYRKARNPLEAWIDEISPPPKPR